MPKILQCVPGPSRMYFMPCYSGQDGHYSSEIDILLDGEKVFEETIEGERCYR